MKKIAFIICSGLIFIPLTACGQTDSEENIVNDVEVQQFDQSYGFQQRANNTDQNERIYTDQELTQYANKAGSYISKTATALEGIALLFESNSLQQRDIESALLTLQQFNEYREDFLENKPPQVFEGFHHVHLATLVEVDALEQVLMEIKEPIDTDRIRNARVHYENAITSHKLMEREYLSITEDHGLH